MKLTRTGLTLFALLVACSFGSLAQDNPTASSKPEVASKATDSTVATQSPDKAAAYYHFAMAHIYEEMVAMYGRSEYANKAIDEYRLAIENDPASDYLNAGLAELYARTGRIKDAVLEAQDILKRDGNNLEAHRLLGRIYLRSLGDMQSGTQSDEILKLAIDQYEQIVKIEPDSVEDHLLLGRLYRLNNDFQKAESEFKLAVKLDPDSEEAVTTLAYLYNEEGDTKRATQVLNSIPDASRSAKVYAVMGFTYEQQKDYKNAIAEAGLRLDRVIGPLGSIINAYPCFQKNSTLLERIRAPLRQRLGKVGTLVSYLPGVTGIVRRILEEPSPTRPWAAPGRMYAFLAHKARTK